MLKMQIDNHVAQFQQFLMSEQRDPMQPSVESAQAQVKNQHVWFLPCLML